jgi:predicted HicB family RNase H-like nuclease
MPTLESRVIAIRVNKDTYERLVLRALRKKIKLGTYLKSFIERELYR